MPTVPVLLALLALTSAAPSASVMPRVIAMPPGTLQAGGLDPGLRDLVPGLLAAALESGAGYAVSTVSTGAEWQLTLSVSGKGPWRLSAQLQPLAEENKSRKLITKKHFFGGREELSHAMDDLATELDRWIRSGGVGEAAPSSGPIPLARALSASTPAVDAYVKALLALHGEAGSSDHGTFDQALKDDPSFCQAAVEGAYLQATLGSTAAALDMLEKSRVGGPCRTQLAEQVSLGLHMLLSGDATGALETASALMDSAPQLRWGRLIHGLALGASGRAREGLDDWRAVTDRDPEDPRGQMWLGLALMSAGEFKTASEAFGRARARLPELLLAYTLQAEAQVRMRETSLARQTLTEMKSYMSSHSIIPDDDKRNPDLMLGAVDLLEGHNIAGLRTFVSALDALEKAGAPPQATDTLHNSVIAMKRDLIVSEDPMTRDRQTEDALRAIDRYQSSQTAEHWLSRPWEIMMLKGLISVRGDDTIDAWKTVDEIKSHAGEPGYSEYFEAYLSGVIMFKEGDAASTQQFERAAKTRGRIANLIELAQVQGINGQRAESHETYEEIARRLARYEPSLDQPPGPFAALIIDDPHLAAMIPIYHFTWAKLAYEMGNGTESRKHFNMMLKYLQNPDRELVPLTKEAYGRGAQPE